MPNTPTPEFSGVAAGGLEKDFDPPPLPLPALPTGVAELLLAEALAVSEGLEEAAPVVDVAEEAPLVPVEGFADGVEENDVEVVDLASVPADAGRVASVAFLEEPEAGVAPVLDGFASTFAGFRSMVTGRFGAPVPAAVLDAAPSPASDDLPSPEDAVPDGEDLPPEGSLSDAI